MTIAPPAPPAAGSAGALLELVRQRGACTRAELASHTGLARSTIAARLQLLQASGLLTAADGAASTGGRPPARFALNHLARIVLGVDLGATHVTVGVTDLAGVVLHERYEPLDISLGPEPVLDRILAILQEVRAEADVAEIPVAGVGIGLPGPVEHATGRPTSPPIMPGWDGFDVPAHIRRSIDAPVLVDNDVNVMAVGEHAASWPEVRHLLFVKVATGIGAGIIADGRIDRGAQGTAGDLGHVHVPGAPDRRCRCGNVGCLEALAAGPALVQRLREAGSDITTPQEVVDRARAGDPDAIGVVRQSGRELGSVLASCVSLLNPSVIVIGGRMAAAAEFLLAGVREVVYGRATPLAAHNLRIVTSSTGARAGVLGAAAMVIESVLSPSSVDRALADLA